MTYPYLPTHYLCNQEDAFQNYGTHPQNRFPFEVVEEILFFGACLNPELVAVIMQLSRRHRDLARRFRYAGFVLADKYRRKHPLIQRYSDVDLEHATLVLRPTHFEAFTSFMDWNIYNGMAFEIAPFIKHLTLSSSLNFVHFCDWLLRSTMELRYLKVNGEYFNATDLDQQFSSLFHSIGQLSIFHDRTGNDLFSFIPTQSLWFMKELTIMLPSPETWERTMLFCENIDSISIIHAQDLTDDQLVQLDYPLSSFCSKGRNRLSHFGIEHVVRKSISKLHTLQIESMPIITLTRLIPLLSQCSHLKKIHINYTTIVDFEPFLIMIRMLTNLEILKMSLDAFENVEEQGIATQLFTMFFMGSKLAMIALSIQSADQRHLFLKAIDAAKVYFNMHPKINYCDYKISKCRA